MNDWIVCPTPSPNLNSCWHCQRLANDLASDSMAYVPDHFVSEPHFAVETDDALFSFSFNVFFWTCLIFFFRPNMKILRCRCRRWRLVCFFDTHTRSLKTLRVHIQVINSITMFVIKMTKWNDFFLLRMLYFLLRTPSLQILHIEHRRKINTKRN